MLERWKLRTLCTAALMMIVVIATASGAPAGLAAVAGQEPAARSGTTLIVTSTADSGPGTLRRAMEEAQPGDTITFDPAVFLPHAPRTIAVTDVLPGLRQGYVTIDASDAGVILDGSQLPSDSWMGGIEIGSDGNTVRGLQVVNFTGTGIVVSPGQGNTIGGDRSIGAGPTGQGNLCSGNAYGIGVWGQAANNTVTGNLIGTGLGGAPGPGNRSGGMWITEGAYDNVIGPDNVIAYNGRPGIEMEGFYSVHNTITRNSIHDNGWQGISASWGANIGLFPPTIFDFDLQAGTARGTACYNCTVEIFSDDSDEGAIYEGQITADGSGAFTFSKGAPFNGPHLTATATDTDGNTSQFSLPTAGPGRSLTLQQDNALSAIHLQTRPSRELLDNRIGAGSVGRWSPSLWDEYFYRAGLKRARVSFNEGEPPVQWDVPEFEIRPEWDAMITRLADNGFKMKCYLMFWDKVTYPGGEGVPCHRFKTEGEIERYLEYVRFIVNHFKDRIEYYEMWNEPDIPTRCPGSIEPADYINLVKRTVPVIREEYPQAKISVGAVSGLSERHAEGYPTAKEYLYTLLQSDIMTLVDVVSWHPFYGESPEHDEVREYYYAYPSIAQTIKDTATAHGFDGEFQVDELTWWPPHPYGDDDPLVVSRTAAAKYASRSIVMHLGMDITANTNSGAGNTLPNLCTVMAGALPTSVPVQIQTSATNIVSYTFSLPDDAYLVTLWTDGIAAEYDPGIPATLTVPGLLDHSVMAIDVLHGFEQPLMAHKEDGNLVIRDLLVKDYPTLLRVSPIRHVFLPVVLRGRSG
jgi:hypothetical protein